MILAAGAEATVFSEISESSSRQSSSVRYLAIDLGGKRTGLAIGDSVLRLPAPVAVLEVGMDERAGEALVEAIGAAVVEQLGPAESSPGELVIGLPINMDGTEGPGAERARGFAARIGRATGRRVHLFDERLTSADADWTMARSGLTHKQKKRRRDALAASALLQSFFAVMERAGPP
jgi:putative Holliday junction resolvase